VANHAPLLFHIPGRTDGGLKVEQLVEFVDIFPTVVEAAELGEPIQLCPELSNTTLLCTEGTSLIPLIDDPSTAEWKSAVFWQYPRGDLITPNLNSVMGYTIRTKEWRYTEWVGITYYGDTNYSPDWENQQDWPELYSMTADPQENFNIASLPEYKEVVAELATRLREGWRAEIQSR